jgi:hypothetical protein
MSFTIILRPYIKHDDITAFIILLFYKSIAIGLPLALYGCENCSLTARKERDCVWEQTAENMWLMQVKHAEDNIWTA